MSSEELLPVASTEVPELADRLQQQADVCAAIASAAQIMDNAGVFNVLSSWPAISILRNIPLLPFLSFLVPDDQIQQAIDAFVANPGYPRCVDPSCTAFREDLFPDVEDSDYLLRFQDVGSAHFHLPSGFELTLYPMSKMAWWLRDLNDESPHLTLASACKAAAWAELYPVRILTQRAFVESLILCRCRDYGRNPSLDSLWRIQFHFFFQRRVVLSDGFMPFWIALRYLDDVCDSDKLLCDLRDKLITRDGLPVHPDHCPDSWKFQSARDWLPTCTAML